MAFKNWLDTNQAALAALSAGLLGGKNEQEQISKGFQGLNQASQQNKTLQWLEASDPELAGAVKNGALTAGDAFKLHYARKLEAEKPKQPNLMGAGGAIYNGDTGEWITPPGFGASQKSELKSVGGALYNEDTGEWIVPPTQQQPVDPVEERKAAAASLGLPPEDPRYQSYVLTGKMPREDAQPLSAGDKRAIQEADDLVLSNQTAIDALSQAEEINKKANSGFLSGSRAVLGNNLPDMAVPDWVSSPESSAATAEYDNLVMGSALGQLKAIFGGNPTEGERAILLDLQASSSKPPEVRKAILARAKAMAAQRLEFNKQRAAELRGGTYYQPRDGSAPAGLSTTKTGIGYKVLP